ncbi:AMP-binding enzyme [Brevibacterium sp. UCMA 11754]|uniref:AMP-binding enzyme n=1 Tax=Brevibacterium sp. UCMA 11754 TaxID=2749198 RepID=UPI002E1DF168
MISPALLARAQQVLPPNLRYTQAYGMTETSTVATLLGPADHTLDGPHRERLRSAGRAVAHSEVKIVDVDDAELPPFAPGQILVRGGHISTGYWNKPVETRETFVDGWIRTGDVGYLDEHGYLFVQDRIKDMIVSGGENVYSTEVEAAIAEHPAVDAVAVVGLPDELWGERVHAVVVLHEGEAATAEEIREHTRQLIAHYKAPRSVNFVSRLPLSGAGKVLKRSIKEYYSGGKTSRPGVHSLQWNG